MLPKRESVTSPFVCTQAGTDKAVTGSLLCCGPHDATLCAFQTTREFRPTEFYANCRGDKILPPQQNTVCKTGHVTQHVPIVMSSQHVL